MKNNAPSHVTALIAVPLLTAATASAHPGHGPMENFSQDAAHTLSHFAPALVAGLLVITLASFVLLSRFSRQGEKIRTRK